MQVKLYNDAGVLIGVHGAGFINCMFMRQGSAVIEVFPYHVKHTLYMREAQVGGRSTSDWFMDATL
jgi:capsular polysaccharide biosynthesis protein